MTYSTLTTGQDALVAAALAVLDGAGYAFAPMATSLNSYLATALTGIGGSTVSHLSMPRVQMLAALVNAGGAGPVSHLTSTELELWALLAGASFGGGGADVRVTDTGDVRVTDTGDTRIIAP